MNKLKHYFIQVSGDLLLMAFLLTCFLLLAGINVYGQNWTPLTPPSGTGRILDVNFIDANTGVITRNYGPDVSITTDGGITWTNSPDLGYDMYHVAINENTIIASGGGGQFTVTNNFGSSWTTFIPYPQHHMHGGVGLATPLIGYAKTHTGYIFKTTDGGLNWTVIHTTAAGGWFFCKPYVVDQNVVFFPHGSDIIKTTDGGSTWTTVFSGSSIIITVDGIDGNSIWASGNNGQVYKTTNGGTSWTTTSTGATGYLWDIAFADANNGWAVGDNGTILSYRNFKVCAVKKINHRSCQRQMRPSAHFTDDTDFYL